MDHVAIMNPRLGFLPQILNGQKTIESRWYRTRRQPWDKIFVGDTIYFKNSGEPITATAKVTRVLQFADLTPPKISNLLTQYGTAIGISPEDLPHYATTFAQKRCAILIFLGPPQTLSPFNISKAGFGSQSAWITVTDINIIKDQKSVLPTGS